MLITQLKPKEDILCMVQGKTFIIGCEGCREVYYPEVEAAQLQKELCNGGAVANVTSDYICNPDNMRTQLKKHAEKIAGADTVLVFSCGVGVQSVAENFPNKTVLAACDTYPVPGFQGLMPLEHDCDQCGECYLNNTGGVCPITACSKSLVNGQCGGAKTGKCEVDKDMECGWDRIYRRLEKLKMLGSMRHSVKIRNFAADAAKPESE